MKREIKHKKTLIVIIIVVIIGIVLGSYGVANLINTPPKQYILTIYLHETENLTQQGQNISTLLREYYEQYYSILPTVGWDPQHPTSITTTTWEPHLKDVISLLESHGYSCSYIEYPSP